MLFGEVRHRRHRVANVAREAVDLRHQQDVEGAGRRHLQGLPEGGAVGGARRARDAGVGQDRDQLVTLALGEGANRFLLRVEAVAAGGLLFGGDPEVAERPSGASGLRLRLDFIPGPLAAHATRA